MPKVLHLQPLFGGAYLLYHFNYFASDMFSRLMQYVQILHILYPPSARPSQIYYQSALFFRFCLEYQELRRAVSYLMFLCHNQLNHFFDGY